MKMPEQVNRSNKPLDEVTETIAETISRYFEIVPSRVHVLVDMFFSPWSNFEWKNGGLIRKKPFHTKEPVVLDIRTARTWASLVPPVSTFPDGIKELTATIKKYHGDLNISKIPDNVRPEWKAAAEEIRAWVWNAVGLTIDPEHFKFVDHEDVSEGCATWEKDRITEDTWTCCLRLKPDIKTYGPVDIGVFRDKGKKRWVSNADPKDFPVFRKRFNSIDSAIRDATVRGVAFLKKEGRSK